MSIAQNFPTIAPSLLLDFANVQSLDNRITFARATTGTYYGTRTAKAEENLFTQSVGMSDWVISNSGAQITRVLNATTAPDNTSTATSIKSVSGNTQASLSAKSTERTFPVNSTISVYAKADGRNFLAINLRSSGGTRSVWFDLINGTVGTAESGNTGQIVNAGNGWYRCIATRTSSDIDQVQFYIADTDGSFTITNNDTIGLFVWGAQAEQRSTVTAYTVTTTQPITNYIPVLETAASGVARFDHNPTTFESLGLLIEQQSTNLVLQSQTFDSATWVKNGGGTAVTVIPNTIIAPDGTLTGDKLDEAGGVTQSQVILQGVTVANSTAHTFSFYAKAAERSFVYTQTQGAGNFQVVFNLTTGTVGVSSGTFTSATITPVGNNWYRCAVTATSTTTNYNWYIEPQATNALGTHLGVANNGIFLWGAQVEALAFPTSYIQTVASQVTRAADSASMTGTNFSSWYAQGEGTLYVESLAQNTAAANNKNLRLHDGVSTSNELWLGSGSPGTSARCQIISGNVTYFDSNMPSQVTANVFGKYAVSFETNNAVLCANGTLGTVDTAVLISSAINQFTILPPSQRAGYYKKIAYYPIAATSAQLQALTG